MMYARKWKKCSKIIKNVRFDIVMHLIPHIQLQIWIFHAILVQRTRSKPIIFWIVAMYGAYQKVTKKVRKCSNLQKLYNMPWISGLYAPNISSKGHASCLQSMSKPPEQKSWKNVLMPRNLKFFIPLAREPTVHCKSNSKILAPHHTKFHLTERGALSFAEKK